MAVLRKRAKSNWKDFDSHFFIEWMKRLLFDPSKTWLVGLALLVAEIVVNMLVIWKIKCEYLVFPGRCDLLSHVHFVFNG